MSGRFLALLLAVLIPVIAHADRPTMTVVTSIYPPYQYLDNGEVKGTHTETLRQVLTRMGYDPVFRLVPWARAEASARAGTADLIYSLTYSPSDVFFSLSDRGLQWQELDDLAGLRIGLSASYSYAPEFMEWLAAGNARVVQISQESPELTGLKMIAFGRIDLFICEETVCRYLIDKHIADHPELANVSAMPRTVGEVRGFRAAFSRQHPKGEALRDEFNKVLAELRTSNSN